jgi:hypothetical protein
MRKPKTAKQKVAEIVTRSTSDVFVPADFTKAKPDTSEYDATLRAVRQLVREGVLVRLAYGVYARTRPSPITGKPMLAAPGGVDGAVRQALKKLNVKWSEGRAVQDYNAGRSTQIPMNASLRVGTRFSRRFSYRGKEIAFERTAV